MYAYGDLHGQWDWFSSKYSRQPENDPYALILGDVGIGFIPECRADYAYCNEEGVTYFPVFPGAVGFIAGNHDNPDLCRKHPNCLGDYGYLEKCNIFFVRGAFSVDYKLRTMGIDLWEDEELSYTELEVMIELFAETKPEYVFSHTCPARLVETPLIRQVMLQGVKKDIDKTSAALQRAFEQHQPKGWFFGHWHVSGHVDIGRTRFYAIGVQQRIEIPGLELTPVKYESDEERKDHIQCISLMDQLWTIFRKEKRVREDIEYIANHGTDGSDEHLALVKAVFHFVLALLIIKDKEEELDDI